MKLLTANFLCCAVKNCASSPAAFPLEFEDAQLSVQETEMNREFLVNILPRIDWEAMLKISTNLGNSSLPSDKPDLSQLNVTEQDQMLRSLHNLLIETEVQEGIMKCGNCKHIYRIHEGIPNMLLAEHEV